MLGFIPVIPHFIATLWFGIDLETTYEGCGKIPLLRKELPRVICTAEGTQCLISTIEKVAGKVHIMF